MWVDLDGSLGLNPGSTVVALEDESLTDQCYPREEWDLKVCQGKYAKVRYQFDFALRLYCSV